MVANKKRKQKRPGSDGAFFSVDEGVRIRLVDANIADCVHSRFNSRKTRDREKIEELAAIIAFAHDPAEQAKFSEADIPENIKEQMMGDE